MGPPRTKKRKPGPETYESEDGFVANDSDASDRPSKKSKTLKKNAKSSQFVSAGEAQLDTDGNEYWEISKMRRVTISEYKGKRMVNIREYYEKDGKELPGKKGISMPIEQYSTLVDILPQIEKALEKKGEQVSRPQYDSTASVASAADQKEQDLAQPQGEQEEEEKEENMKPETKNAKRRKANIEATSDEEDDD